MFYITVILFHFSLISFLLQIFSVRFSLTICAI